MSATIYYKATRIDGTDFRTGTILYEVGRRARPAPLPAAQAQLCGPGYLHAADVPAMSLVGGYWPCRLFEVTGTPRAGFDSRHPHKGGFRQLDVVAEIDAHLALGPNGHYVAGVIERTRQLTRDEALKLDAAWGAAWGAARGAARDAAWGAAWGAARDAAIALLARDLITPEQFETLYGPWRSVIGDVTS